MKIVIPWVPPTLNQYCRAHWTKQRAWVDLAAAHIYSAVGRGPRYPTKVRVEFQQYRKRTVDRDNATPKVLCDALVRLSWVEDDSENWMEQVVLPVIVDRKNPRTEITIETLAGTGNSGNNAKQFNPQVTTQEPREGRRATKLRRTPE